MRRLLIATGFEPWGPHLRNTSWDCLEAVSPNLEIPGWRIETRRLPVTWSIAGQAAAEIATAHPDAVVCFGQSPRPYICLEQVTRPENSPTARDVRDELAPCGSGEPLRSTLPLARIARSLEEAGLANDVSESAGDYLCNCLFHRVLTELRRHDRHTIAGFIHVPIPGLLPDAAIQQAMRICITEAAASAERSGLQGDV